MMSEMVLIVVGVLVFSGYFIGSWVLYRVQNGEWPSIGREWDEE